MCDAQRLTRAFASFAAEEEESEEEEEEEAVAHKPKSLMDQLGIELEGVGFHHRALPPFPYFSVRCIRRL